MPLFNDAEKALLQEAVALYLQLGQQRFPQGEFEKIYQIAQELMAKIETAGEDPGGRDGKPRGISDEWFKHCCRKCDKLAPGGKCQDKITEKFPGKCDPILIYERAKAGKNRP